MATNITYKPGYERSVVVADPAAPVSGVPIRIGNMTGIALTDIAEGGNDATHTSVDFGPFSALFPVIDEVGGGIALYADLFYDNALDGLTNDPAGNYYYGFSLGTVGVGLTATIEVQHIPTSGFGALGAGTVGTVNLAAGLLSADANGRAKMAAGYFDVATVLNKFAANSFTTANLLSLLNADGITNAVLLQAVLDGAFQADAPTRALFADLIWTGAKIADLTLTEGKLAAADGLTLNALRTAKFEFDFATDAHVMGTTVMRGATLPAKARIVGGHCYIKTALTGAGGTTASIQVTGANDIIADAAVAGAPWSTSDAMVPIVPVNTTVTCVKSEAAGGKPSLVIGTHDLTAGHIDLWLNYVVHD